MHNYRRQVSLVNSVVSLQDFEGIEEIQLKEEVEVPMVQEAIIDRPEVKPDFMRKCYSKPFTCPLNDLVDEYVNRVEMIEFDMKMRKSNSTPTRTIPLQYIPTKKMMMTKFAAFFKKKVND